MPTTRKRLARHLRTSARFVDPQVFRWHTGVGPDPYFKAPGYDTPGDAEHAWRQVRREVWATCHRFDVPKAATVYDGLTRTAWPLLWGTWTDTSFDANQVLESVAEDLAAVDDFEAEDPQGARVISDYLAEWRADLATVRECATACLECDSRSRLDLDISRRITTAEKYGSNDWSQT